MKAVLMERGRLWVDTLPEPEPERGEVLVRSRACGICGSDLHAVKHTEAFVATSREAGGAFKLTTFDPVVLGHEFSAEIVAYGPGTERRFAPGTLVCSVPVLLRDEFVGLGYSTSAPGGFAELMILSERLLVPVPSGTPAHCAALTEPLAVGLHAVNKARLSGSEAIAVMGAGPVGLAVLIALKHRGAGPVIVSDFSPARRALAERLGADAVVDPRIASPLANPLFAKEVLARDRDVVIFECVGVRGIIDQIFVAAPRNARIVVVGVCLEHDASRPLIAINKELSVQYVLGYTTDEFAETLRFIADGAIDVSQLVTDRVGLDGVAAAFAALADPERHAKIIVEPQRPS